MSCSITYNCCITLFAQSSYVLITKLVPKELSRIKHYKTHHCKVLSKWARVVPFVSFPSSMKCNSTPISINWSVPETLIGHSLFLIAASSHLLCGNRFSYRFIEIASDTSTVEVSEILVFGNEIEFFCFEILFRSMG